MVPGRYDGYQSNTNYQGRDGFAGKKTPYFDTVTFRFMPEAGARTAALQTGEVHVLEALAIPAFRWKGLEVPAAVPFERVTVREACRRWAGIDLFALPEADGLRAAVRAQGMRAADDDGWDDLVTRILLEKVEPELGRARPTLLLDYPISQAALARPKPDDPRLAERFELYVAGLELANAFS